MVLEEILKGLLEKSELSISEVMQLKKMESMVRCYCNFSEEEHLPNALKFVIAQSSADLIREFCTENQKLKSISMGDTDYSFFSESEKLMTEKLEMQKEVLRRYRKLKK